MCIDKPHSCSALQTLGVQGTQEPARVVPAGAVGVAQSGGAVERLETPDRPGMLYCSHRHEGLLFGGGCNWADVCCQALFCLSVCLFVQLLLLLLEVYSTGARWNSSMG